MTARSPVHDLQRLGQSVWLDDLPRRMIRSGELKRRIEQDGLRGAMLNPGLLQRALGTGDYDGDIAALADAGHTPAQICEAIACGDVAVACDLLRPVYEQSDGADGFASLEVAPHLAEDRDALIAEAERLWQRVDRPNLMIRIPGTPAGIGAGEELLYRGRNIHMTLLVSIGSYERAAEAHLRALERRVAAGQTIDRIASVASFFLSRVDVLVDELIADRLRTGNLPGGEEAAQRLSGRAGLANGKLAYDSLAKRLESERWAALARHGARPQRLAWASTSPKNPAYRDLAYVEPLIGPHSVTILADKTYGVLLDHGRIDGTATTGLGQAMQDLAELQAAGIDHARITEELEAINLRKFAGSIDALQAGIASRQGQSSRSQTEQTLRNEAQRLRRLVIRMTNAAGSGHPTSCMSAADIVAALYFHTMRWDPSDARARDVDSFIFSKGHAAPLLWAALSEAGAIADDPLTLRKIDSRLEGHPTPSVPWVKVATGSLGQGLAAANGIALANRLDGIDSTIYVLMGDGECAEGSVWEAAEFAARNKLSNMVAIVDVNALGQSGPTPERHDTGVYARRFEAFGWNAVEIDGHDMSAILDVLERAGRTPGQTPTAIIARTIKGKGVSFLEGKEGWHGKPLDKDQMAAALAELGEDGPQANVEPRRLGQAKPWKAVPAKSITIDYPRDKPVATREAYGHALAKLGKLRPEIVAIDGDTMNSTYAEFFAKEFPDRFFEAYIAEQSMAGTGLGLAVSGKIPYVATFACFLTRAADFIRMAAYSRPAHLVFCGSHAGISIGEDGSSQMGLEDVAMFRAVEGTTVLCPADAVSAERLTEAAAECQGIVYIRTTRPKLPILYDAGESFPIGGSKTLRSSGKDLVTIIASGVTVAEALAAHDALAKCNVAVRVVDAYSIKPIDRAMLARAAEETQGILTVEDHRSEGGLGDAVAEALPTPVAIQRLAVRGIPHSGTAEQLLDRHGISRRAIEEAVMALVG